MLNFAVFLYELLCSVVLCFSVLSSGGEFCSVFGEVGQCEVRVDSLLKTRAPHLGCEEKQNKHEQEHK
jgi:hypothetical protein